MNCLFALPESTYIHTVTKHCRAALVHGFIRKTAKGAVYVQTMTATEQHIAEKELNNVLKVAKKKAKTAKGAVNAPTMTATEQHVAENEPNNVPKIAKKKAKKVKTRKRKLKELN